jgi:hypothetical protein
MGIVLPSPPFPPNAHGQTAKVWVPVDRKGRAVRSAIRVDGITDSDFAEEIRSAAAQTKWQRPIREGCWVPGWGFTTFTF